MTNRSNPRDQAIAEAKQRTLERRYPGITKIETKAVVRGDLHGSVLLSEDELQHRDRQREVAEKEAEELKEAKAKAELAEAKEKEAIESEDGE